MNKYQKAIGSLRWSAELCNLCDMDDVDTLQELVEKATPKKPKETEAVGEHYYACPKCGALIEEIAVRKQWANSKDFEDTHAYCYRCGQRILWGEDDANS